MENVVETLTRGNVAEVKVVLASVALALGVYQLAVKVSVVRRDFGLGRFLPVLGISVFALLCLTWSTSAGVVLA